MGCLVINDEISLTTGLTVFLGNKICPRETFDQSELSQYSLQMVFILLSKIEYFFSQNNKRVMPVLMPSSILSDHEIKHLERELLLCK